MAEPSKPAGRPRFIRFSLLSFMLLVSVICVSVSHVQLSKRNAVLEQEVHKLRQELGYLNVDDPQKVYVRQVPSNEQLTWKYRVYLPPKRQYRINVRTGTVNKGGYPRSGTSRTNNNFTGRFTVIVSLNENRKEDRWDYKVSTPGSVLSGGIDNDVIQWVGDKQEHFRVVSMLQQQQSELMPDQDVELLRLMTADGANETGAVFYFDLHKAPQ